MSHTGVNRLHDVKMPTVPNIELSIQAFEELRIAIARAGYIPDDDKAQTLKIGPLYISKKRT